jgi:putative methionine-R-sulfoxide reductase with GAF domain
VFDLDSPRPDRFDAEDQDGIEAIARHSSSQLRTDHGAQQRRES